MLLVTLKPMLTAPGFSVLLYFANVMAKMLIAFRSQKYSNYQYRHPSAFAIIWALYSSAKALTVSSSQPHHHIRHFNVQADRN